MCIAVFLWKAHPLYPFVLLLNRDEYYDRPTNPLTWWEDEQILGGRDGLAGGTWLASTRNGRVAFLTNVREVKSPSGARSRGDLPVRFLKSSKNPKEFAEELIEEADLYNGFNMICADLCSMMMVYITNRPKGDGLSITEVSPGMHVLSNAKLDTAWPKSERLRHGFKDLLDKFGEAELPVQEISETLMNDAIKDKSTLPGIYSPEWEYSLSSIFVEVDTPLGKYGTRSTSALTAKMDGEVRFYERRLEDGSWKENCITYVIGKPT